MGPKISVIIIHRKGESYDLALKTIQAQTFKNIEIIVIEDTEGKGAPWARNEGAKLAHGQYLLFSDCDIHWYSNALQVMLDFLEAHPECSYSYGAYRMIGQRATFSAVDFNADELKNFNYISTMSLIRKADFPGFDESIQRFQDWDLWLTLLAQGKIGIFCQRIIFTTAVREGISIDKDGRPRSYDEERNLILKKHGLYKEPENHQTVVANNEEVPEEKDPNLKIFFAVADWGGCGYMRMITPALYLAEKYPDIKTEFSQGQHEFIEKADIVVFQRQFKKEVLTYIDYLHNKMNKKVVYELDDDFWHMPADNGHRYVYSPENMKGIEQIISRCDAVTVSTEPLAEQVRKFNKNVVVLPNSLEFVPWMDEERGRNEKVRIGWVGGHQHKGDLGVIIPVLQEIVKKYGERVQLVFMGDMPKEFLGVAEHYPFVPFELYMHSMQELRLDIGLLPLEDNLFNRSKSCVKFAEYSAVWAASVASPVGPYLDTIEHEKTGLIVKKNRFGKWVEAISELVESQDERDRLAGNAGKMVRENFNIETRIQDWERFYRGLVGK